jgi:hypothetical protein
MKSTSAMLRTIFAVTLTGLYFGAAIAEQIPAQKPDAVQGKCGQSGGVHFPKTGPNSTYGCINPDGSGIVCGGITKKDKQTCDTFLQTPPRLPTRFESGLANRANADSKTQQGK